MNSVVNTKASSLLIFNLAVALLSARIFNSKAIPSHFNQTVLMRTQEASRTLTSDVRTSLETLSMIRYEKKTAASDCGSVSPSKLSQFTQNAKLVKCSTILD